MLDSKGMTSKIPEKMIIDVKSTYHDPIDSCLSHAPLTNITARTKSPTSKFSLIVCCNGSHIDMPAPTTYVLNSLTSSHTLISPHSAQVISLD